MRSSLLTLAGVPFLEQFGELTRLSESGSFISVYPFSTASPPTIPRDSQRSFQSFGFILRAATAIRRQTERNISCPMLMAYGSLTLAGWLQHLVPLGEPYVSPSRSMPEVRYRLPQGKHAAGHLYTPKLCQGPEVLHEAAISGEDVGLRALQTACHDSPFGQKWLPGPQKYATSWSFGLQIKKASCTGAPSD